MAVVVKCAMACKPCKSATCRGSLMIASPVQREIASGHLYLCALLISPCNSSPFRIWTGKKRSSIRDRGIQQQNIAWSIVERLENFSDFKLWMQFLVNDFLTHLKLVSTLRFVISSGIVKILLYYVIRKRIIMLIQVNVKFV